ncbi:non-ribosomal peptide synthetase [Variovorax ginsengisoli]|uniref:Amino acid adenylation domain-containing protein n=1 Tax=Variovorax ginsengisoli TaxID=363844 RepID=A0ABT9SBK1_9BURK|nr:non-ribosomal peptide synthetase [Variovorax ginsengisoli]MDP9901731.1 amino acid adenylation domain-containing protein [Variovorax ginsengisoli]
MAVVFETPVPAAVPSAATTLPLSPEQRAIATMPQARHGDAVAALTLVAVIDGPLDAVRLRAAVQAAAQAHESLRSAVLQVPGLRGLRQQLLDAAPMLDWCAADARDAALADWLEAFAREPFDIAQGRVLRAALLEGDDQRHRLVLAVSALAADRASLLNLLDEIAVRYRGEEAAADEEEVFQYGQFVEWRQDLEGGDEARHGRAYWSAYAGDAADLQAPRLGVRRDGPAAQAAQAAQVLAIQRVGDAGVLAALDRAASAADLSPQTVLQAAWWLLVGRLTEGRAFVGGWQHDCRQDYEVMQGSVGVFEKILPIAVQIAPEQSFADWAVRLGGVLAAHAEAQEYWAIDAPPMTSQLEVGFAFHERRADRGWRVDAAPGPQPCFELALQVERGADELTLSLHGDAARYSAAAAQRLLMQFRTLLDAGLAQPGEPVSALPLVGAQERELLLAQHGAALDVGVLSLSAQVGCWAEVSPDAPALEAGELRLSYRDFDERINRMAHWLAGRGVKPGTLVALSLPRSAGLLVAMLASWRIGAGYLPMDPEWPAARRDAVVSDAKPSLVLEIAPDDAELGAFPASLPAHEASAHDLAYVLYTSGSTGQPKGVVIAQGQLHNYVAAASAAMQLGRCRRWALTSSVVADLGNTALFAAFFNGACLVVAGPDDTRDARAFAGFMRRCEIDALKMVPSHLEALLEDEAPVLPATLVLGGEATPRALVERLQRLAPACAIYNHYGPTETTVGVMVHRVSADDAASAVLPLTQVLGNNRVYVFDAALVPVPAGVLGAVYVGGAQVCCGYLNGDAGEAFVDDPLRPGERLYRTGDLAHVLPEGGLRLAGRADHQVKIRGFRVEPAEVEAVLLAQPGVRQAAVLAVPSNDGGVQLQAFAVGGEEDGAALVARLGALLPAHMVPARCTMLAEFPRLPNGKIDRLALLPLAEGQVPPTSTPSVAPRDALEFVLALSMAKLLQREDIGVEDDFFELGGHSLLVIKLVARIRKLLHIEVAPGVVFDHSSAGALAQALRSAQGDNAAALEQLEQLAQSHRDAAGATA